MRKFCNILSIIIIFALILISGCGESNSYFKFSDRNITTTINAEFSVFDLKIETNIKNYKLVSVVAEKSDLVEINKDVIKAIDIGSTKIIVKIKSNDNNYTASFNLTINNSGLSENNSLNYTYEVLEIDNEFNILNLVIYKQNEIYSNFSVVLNFEDENNLLFERKTYNYYEVKFYKNARFSLVIKDLSTNEEFLINID